MCHLLEATRSWIMVVFPHVHWSRSAVLLFSYVAVTLCCLWSKHQKHTFSFHMLWNWSSTEWTCMRSCFYNTAWISSTNGSFQPLRLNPNEKTASNLQLTKSYTDEEVVSSLSFSTLLKVASTKWFTLLAQGTIKLRWVMMSTSPNVCYFVVVGLSSPTSICSRNKPLSLK